MTRWLTLALLPALALTLVVGVAARPADERKGGPPLAHMVFFTLKDQSKEARDKFVASCEKYLTDHEGATYFSIGLRAEDSDEGAVSVKDFDVALHVVFDSKASKEKYLVHPRHKSFVEENRAQFAKVRVFDSYLIETKR